MNRQIVLLAFCFGILYESLVAGQDDPKWLISIEIRTESLPKQNGNAGQLEMSPDGRWIGVHDGAIYRRDDKAGTVTLVHTPDPAASVVGLPYFAPDSRYFYVLGTRSTVASAIDQGGGITTVQTVSDKANDVIVGLNSPEFCCIPPDGKHLYAADGQDQTLVCFSRDPETGKLEFIECLQDDSADKPLAGAPRSIAKLFPPALKVDGVGQIQTIASAPDGKQLFMGVEEGSRLTIFDRVPATGRLRFVSEVKRDGARESNGVHGVESIALAGKGRFLVTASRTGGLTLFTHDPAERKPTFVEVFLDDPVDMPRGPSNRHWMHFVPYLWNLKAVAFLPNESGLIAASSHHSALHAFRFDADGPSLKWVGCVRDGENGITGLRSVRDIAISPDGKFLYAASANATVAVFEIKL